MVIYINGNRSHGTRRYYLEREGTVRLEEDPRPNLMHMNIFKSQVEEEENTEKETEKQP